MWRVARSGLSGYALGLRLIRSSHAALGAVAFAFAGACATPPEDEVIGGLPCDSDGKCASGFVCVENKCVRPGTQIASNGGSNAGGIASDASSGGEGTGGAAGGGGVGVGPDASSGGAGGSAGSGGAGTGGLAKGGAGGNSGAGGTSGAGGAGGAGGTSGAGGIGGAGGAGGSTSIGVYCGGTTCALGNSCCSDPSTDNATCEGGGCDLGVARIECDGPEDCSNGESCCRESSTGTARYSCQQACGTGTVPIGCSGPQNCSAPKVCCETTVSAFPPRASDAACVDTCTGSNQYVMCNVDADCPQTEPSCQPAGALPGFHRCF
jgi:hypothetical protein